MTTLREQAHHRPRILLATTFLVMMCICLCACDERGIETYRAPKEKLPDVPSLTPMIEAQDGRSLPITWKLPPGWREAANTQATRAVTILTGDNADAGDVSITSLPGDAGGALMNINRWRGQVGLPPVQSLGEQEVQGLSIDGRPAAYLEFIAPDGADALFERMLMAMIVDGNQTWFIKMTGSHEVVAANKQAFESFLNSFKWNRTGQ